MNSKDSHLGEQVHLRLIQLLGPDLVDRLERRTAQEAADRIAATVDRVIMGDLNPTAAPGPQSRTPGYQSGSLKVPFIWDRDEIRMEKVGETWRARF